MVRPSNPNGNVLAAYDVATNRQLWQRQAKSPIDERMIAVNAGKLFALTLNRGSVLLGTKNRNACGAMPTCRLAGVDKINNRLFQDAIFSLRGLIATDQGSFGVLWMRLRRPLAEYRLDTMPSASGHRWPDAPRIRNGRKVVYAVRVDRHVQRQSLVQRSISSYSGGPSTATPESADRRIWAGSRDGQRQVVVSLGG